MIAERLKNYQIITVNRKIISTVNPKQIIDITVKFVLISANNCFYSNRI